MAVGNHQKAMELQSEKSWIFRRETMRWLYPEVDRVIFPWKGAIKSPCETQVNHRQIISKSMGRSAIEKKKRDQSLRGVPLPPQSSSKIRVMLVNYQ